MSIATRIQSIEEHISDAYDSLSKFGVAAPSNKNIKNIASLVNEIYDNTPKTDYVSGTDLTLENTRIGKIDFKDTDNIEKIGLGATSQDSEPTPDSPQDINVVKGNQNISVQNKNLIENETFTQGSAFENSLTTRISCRNTKLKANTTYTISSDLNYSIFSIALTTSAKRFPVSSNTDLIYNSNWKNANFNFTTGDNDVYLNISIMRVNNTNISPSDVAENHFQLEEGTTVTSYIPHQENNYEINLGTSDTIINKNLIQDETFVQGGAPDNTAAIRISCRNIKLKANTTYTLSSTLDYNDFNINICTSGTAFPHPPPYTYDSGWKNKNFSFTVGSNDVYANIAVRKSANTTIVPSDIDGYHFQIEKGDTATPYEPYKTPIELCKINTYQDYIYKNGKNWYLHKEIKKIILDGTESWTTRTASTGAQLYETSVSGFYSTQLTVIGFSNQYIPEINLTNDNTWRIMNGNILAIHNNTIGSISNLQTFLSNNNLIIYYPFATPTETQITDSTLISQLDAWYNAQSMDDTTHITVDGDLPMQLKLKALKK